MMASLNREKSFEIEIEKWKLQNNSRESRRSQVTASASGDEEEKVADVGEGEQQSGEAGDEEEAAELQQQQEVDESPAMSQPQTNEECQPNPEETTIPKGLDDNSKIYLLNTLTFVE